MNPILAREIRARFRERYSFLLLFALTLVLCVAAYWIYGDAVYYNDIRASSVYPLGQSVSTETASEIGRTLFSSLAMVNCIAWLLVAPALTATGLARERERGLLESLWLSPFRVRSQIGGRYAASLLFLGLLQFATAPIYGLAMLLGGVSPGEVGLCGLIIAMTAVVGAALGLWCSARAYRPISALGSALGFVVIWSLVAFFGPTLFNAVFFYFNLSWVIDGLQILARPHPLLLLMSALDMGGPFPTFRLLSSWSPFSIYGFGVGLQLLFTILLLVGATRVASKPLPEMAWLGRHPYLERWKRSLAERKKAREAQRDAARMSERVGGALLYEVPFEKLARFRDPLLQREVRGRFRLRQSGVAVALMRLAALFIVVLVWLWMLWNLYDPPSRGGAGEVLTYLLWFLGALTVAVIASSSLTRERESGTWQGLQLSLLGPKEIVRSKWLSPLVTFLYWSIPIWLWLPLSVLPSANGAVPLWPFLGVLSLSVCSISCISALGLFISSLLRSSAAATSWTIVALLGYFVLLPIGVESTGFKNWVVLGVSGMEAPTYPIRYSSFPTNADRRLISDYETQMQLWRRANSIFDSYHQPIAAGNILSRSSYYPLDDGTKLLIWLSSFVQATLLTLLLLQGAKRQILKPEK